MFDLYFQDTC